MAQFSGDHSLAGLADGLKEVLRVWREERLQQLADFPPALMALADGFFLDGQPRDARARRRSIGLLLEWGIDQLRPHGEQSWLAPAWRDYNTLRGYYAQRMSQEELALELSCSLSRVAKLRDEAVRALVRTLEHALRDALQPERAAAVADSQRAFAARRLYEACSPDQQALLRRAAILCPPVPVDWLAGKPGALRYMQVWKHLDALADAGLLAQSSEGVSMPAELVAYAERCLTAEEAERWRSDAIEYEFRRDGWLQAARHCLLAGEPLRAAQTLLDEERKRNMLACGQAEALAALLETFPSTDISRSVWGRLRILAGDVAQALGRLDQAARHYHQALAIQDDAIVADALYRHARVLELQQKFDEVLSNYTRSIALLRQTGARGRLLAEALVHRAWIYIQQRPDVAAAEADLNHARALLQHNDRDALWAQLQNAAGWLSAHAHGDFDAAIRQYQDALVVARNSGDTLLICKILINLGRTCLGRQMQRPMPANLAHGEEYLKEARQLATQTGALDLQATCEKAIGNVCYFRGQYAQAMAHYLRARQAFIETGNRDHQTNTCYDLVETALAMGDREAAGRYYDEGLSLAQEQGDQDMIRMFNEIGRATSGLYPLGLNERQRVAMDVVKQAGYVTARALAERTRAPLRNVQRDLGQLVERGLLRQMGKARAARYILPEGDSGESDAGDE